MDPLSCRIVANWGGGGASMFLQAEEDVDARLNWTGSQALRSEVRPSLTSDRNTQQPAQFERASTSSSACKNMDETLPPKSATTLPLRVSVRSAPLISSPSSGRSASEWTRPDLDFPQKTLVLTLSALAEPCPCTSQGSQTGPSWPSGGGAARIYGIHPAADLLV